VDRDLSWSATHGRQQTDPNVGMGERQGISSTFWVNPPDHLVSPAEVEFGQQLGKAAGVEAMNGRGRCAQLNVMPPIGRQMKVAPVDCLFPETAAESAHPKAPNDSTHANVDSGDLETAVLDEGEKNVGHSGHAMPIGIEDLGVQNVAPQQEFVGIEVGVVDEARASCGGGQPDGVRLKGSDGAPRDEVPRPRMPTDDEPMHGRVS